MSTERKLCKDRDLMRNKFFQNLSMIIASFMVDRKITFLLASSARLILFITKTNIFETVILFLTFLNERNCPYQTLFFRVL